MTVLLMRKDAREWARACVQTKDAVLLSINPLWTPQRGRQENERAESSGRLDLSKARCFRIGQSKLVLRQHGEFREFRVVGEEERQAPLSRSSCSPCLVALA